MEKNYYLIIDGEKVIVTEEIYRAYMRPEWREDRNKRNRLRCRDAKGVRCKKDCEECDVARFSFWASGSDFSLENLAAQESCVLPVLPDPIDEVILNEALTELKKIVSELDEDDLVIVRTIMNGTSKKDSARLLNITPASYNYREKRLLNKIRKKMQDFI